MRNRYTWIVVVLLFSGSLFRLGAQEPADTTRSPFASGGIYDRPYILKLGGNTAVGGYAEFNSNSERVDGIAEGFTMEARRFNVFIYSAVSEHVKLTSELEFEHGTREIKLETALVDLLLTTPLNFRAGVLLSPIGRFNLSHDAPRYNVIDRPLVSTMIIPSTLSEVGGGIFGAFYATVYDRISYELYVVNGLHDGVLLGSGEGTRIPLGRSESAFEEDNNGSPALTGRLAYNPRFGGEFGVSFHSGYYNRFRIEGEMVDERRRLDIFALDAEWKRGRLLLRGEAALARIETPDDHADRDLLARRQRGFYAEANYTFWRRPMLGMEKAALIAFGRFDDVDLNAGTFSKTGQNIGDHIRRLTIGLAMRPTSDTVFRVSYWRQWQHDLFNNLSHSMNLQIGAATYF